MKKMTLTILMMISLLAFFSCDNNDLPEVSEQEALAAITHSMTAMTTEVTYGMLNMSSPGVTYAVDGNGKVTLTFSSYDISATATPYTSMSGSITVAGDNIVYNLSLAGGPVVTIYIEINSSGTAVLEVNGRDMSGTVTMP